VPNAFRATFENLVNNRHAKALEKFQTPKFRLRAEGVLRARVSSEKQLLLERLHALSPMKSKNEPEKPKIEKIFRRSKK